MYDHASVSATADTVIEPPRVWRPVDLSEMWRYRDLLGLLAGRDLRLRYRQTFLGAAWVILQPLVGATVFTVVFGRIARLPSDGVPYLLFAFAGLLGWNAFSDTVTRAQGCLVQNSNLVSKVYFPRMLLPLATAGSVALDVAVSAAFLAAMSVFLGRPVPATALLAPVWIGLLMAAGAGLGLMLSALTVSYRDVPAIAGPLMQFALYASPVAYSTSVVPSSLTRAFLLNPLTGLLQALRWSVFGCGGVEWWAVAYGGCFALALLAAGALCFRRMEVRFADVI